MESLALLVVGILLVIYGSGLIAFVLSWFRGKVTRIICFIFSGLAIATGLWTLIQLWDGNGLFVGGIPVALGAISIWNAIRISKRA